MKQNPKTSKSFSFYQIQFPFIKPIPLCNSHREPPKIKKQPKFPFRLYPKYAIMKKEQSR